MLVMRNVNKSTFWNQCTLFYEIHGMCGLFITFLLVRDSSSRPDYAYPHNICKEKLKYMVLHVVDIFNVKQNLDLLVQIFNITSKKHADVTAQHIQRLVFRGRKLMFFKGCCIFFLYIYNTFQILIQKLTFYFIQELYSYRF